MIRAYLEELGSAGKTRGRARRRFASECAAHLEDAAARHGEIAAVAAFGDPRELAAEFDLEVATARGLRATWWTAAAVLGVAGSTLVLIGAADPVATASPAVAIAFFVFAQVAAVAGGVACVRACVLRRGETTEAELRLLARRNVCALSAAAATILAAGVALPGRGSTVALVAGPLLAIVAGVAVARAGRLAGTLRRGGEPSPPRPLPQDLAALTGLPLSRLTDAHMLTIVTLLAASAAWARDRGEGSTPTAALLVAAIEAAAVIAGFLLLAGPLGLRRGAS
jgi:hypothetical protein